jgi:2-iminobutanoate/2-iminopropanoate deaminase
MMDVNSVERYDAVPRGTQHTVSFSRSGDEIMEQIQTTDAPAAIGPYSQAIAQGQLLFTSGQLPIDPATGELRNNDIVLAARQVLLNLRAVLIAGRADMNTVIKTTVFMKDMQDFKAFNEIYAEFFKEPFPARSCVQVAALPKEALVEIEAVAVRKE